MEGPTSPNLQETNKEFFIYRGVFNRDPVDIAKSIARPAAPKPRQITELANSLVGQHVINSSIRELLMNLHNSPANLIVCDSL